MIGSILIHRRDEANRTYAAYHRDFENAQEHQTAVMVSDNNAVR
jgi:hypothetical protein